LLCLLDGQSQTKQASNNTHPARAVGCWLGVALQLLPSDERATMSRSHGQIPSLAYRQDLDVTSSILNDAEK